MVSPDQSSPVPTRAHPQWPGTQPPADATPARRPRSVRRTSTVDMLHPFGLDGDVVLAGLGRDLRTGEDGAGTVVDTGSTRVRLRYMTDRVVTEVSADPPLPQPVVEGLVGVRASGGFRKALDHTMGDAAGNLTYLLLDEVPVATLIAGAALTIVGAPRLEGPNDERLKFLDVCAGWASSGSMATKLVAGEASWDPGPAAPSLEVPDDPLAWHEVGPLQPGEMRRRRRTDVIPAEDGGPVVVDAMFRDTAVDGHGIEVVIHEYSLRMELHPTTHVVLSVDVVARVLPGPECPNAVASAQRVVGVAVADLRDFVREHFGGVSTCTHLNDQLRALADVATLLPHVAAGSPSTIS